MNRTNQLRRIAILLATGGILMQIGSCALASVPVLASYGESVVLSLLFSAAAP